MMDCVTFRKLINQYLSNELTDEELNDFLAHLKSCPECRDELEINYIVIEGINILDEERSDYDLTKAYDRKLKSSEHYLSFRKVLLTIRYVIDTAAFWAFAAALFYFLYNHYYILFSLIS